MPPASCAQLCKGANEVERKRFHIPDDLEQFAYLRASGCSQIAGTDDAADFAHVKHSMSVVGIDHTSQVGLHWCLEGVFHWGCAPQGCWRCTCRWRPACDVQSITPPPALAGLLCAEQQVCRCAIERCRMPINNIDHMSLRR